jgi:carbon monoxide dehydrogenase subunit G
MTTVTVTDIIAAPIDDVWALLADFGGIARIMRGMDDVQVVGEGLGQDRVISLGGGARVVERLTWHDPDAYAFSYTIVEGAGLPMQRYVATVRLSSQDSGTHVHWQGHFVVDGDEADAVKLVEGIYRGGIKGTRRALEG